ncbi:MAG: ABC transporter substrate-binding protein [Propionicimonas sp.]|uniref:ABC transporter substrate-binding protein n=1 Tax=Propionicimonas sp. TaxID=1955623 RepID=UPI002B201FF7|nr:ABC transporter substrate-binding protein [Propionicimonas sp.]MEA4944691.1 ABC transporter substrate-binding protein [Propionicimonas sp.]
MLLKKTALVAGFAALALTALTACSGTGTPAAPSSSAPAPSTSASESSTAPSESSAPAADLELVTPGTLTICSDVPYKPFEYEDASSPSGYTGFDIEVVDAIAQKLGLTLKVVVTNFDALQSGTALAADSCDMAASAMTITDERKKNLDFAEPYYDSLQSLLVKADSGITDLASTAGKRIGVQKGSTGKHYATENAPSDTTLVDFPDDGKMFIALKAGQVQGLLQDHPVNHQHEVDDPTYKVVETYNTNEQYGFAFAKGKRPALLAAVGEQLAALRADGSYDTLYKKYFG